MAGGEIARRDELLAHLLERLRLARQRALDPVPERDRHAVQVAHEPPQALRHERERLVGALPRVVEREVLLDHACAEHEADERHGDPALVVGETDREVGEALAIDLDHAQVELVDLARIRGRALHQAELRVDREDGVDGALDVLERPSARREEDRPSVRRDVPEERRVDEVGGGDLEGGSADLGEEVRARLVERGAEERHVELARDSVEVEPLLARELERLAVLAVGRAEGVLVVVRQVEERARVQPAVVALLQLDRVRAALLRRTEQLLRLLVRALVVVPDLGDDVRLAVIRDPPTVYDELPHRPKGTHAGGSARRIAPARDGRSACRWRTTSPTTTNGMKLA